MSDYSNFIKMQKISMVNNNIAFILIMQVCKATLEREALSRNLITAEMRCEVATDINLSTAVQKISTDKFLTCMYEVDVTYFHGTLKRIPLQ